MTCAVTAATVTLFGVTIPVLSSAYSRVCDILGIIIQRPRYLRRRLIQAAAHPSHLTSAASALAHQKPYSTFDGSAHYRPRLFIRRRVAIRGRHFGVYHNRGGGGIDQKYRRRPTRRGWPVAGFQLNSFPYRDGLTLGGLRPLGLAAFGGEEEAAT